MPTYRLSKTVSLMRGARAFLRLEAGVTRGSAPDDTQRTRAKKHKAARPDTENKRQQPSQKQGRGRPKVRTSARGKSKTTRKAEGPTETGSLPDFLILGAEKGGTSTFYWTLCRHPRVERATKKEVHFFDSSRRWFEKGVGWYRSQFPAPTWRDGLKVITGEATPYYLFHPYSPGRASTTVPDAKLIALLRNPVDRAYPRHAYRARGIYVDQLKRWHEHFDPDQLLVLKSEDYFADPVGTMHRVHVFLGLPKSDEIIERRKKRPYQPMDPATRRRLEEYFEPHNQELYEYLGVDFGW